jgi:hypothetical protein
MYYYKTDLRDASLSNATGSLGQDVATNNVPTTDADKANWQHMVTFSLALADGLMTWQSDYATATTGDYKNITTGASGCWWSGPAPATGEVVWKHICGHGRAGLCVLASAVDGRLSSNALRAPWSPLGPLRSMDGS